MNKQHPATITNMTEYLEEVGAQIAYKPLRPSVLCELREHILERTEEFEAEGLSREEAEQKAVSIMGDAITVGTEINAVRHVRNNRVLTALTAFLILFSFAAAVYMYFSPDIRSDGYFYYIPGIVILVLTTYKGYPWLVTHWRKLLIIAAFTYFTDALLSLIHGFIPQLQPYVPYSLFRLSYYELLLLAPVLSITLYSVRRKGTKAVLAVFLAAASAVIYCCLKHRLISSALMVFLLSLTATAFLLITTGAFLQHKFRLYVTASISFLALASICLFFSWQANHLQTFINPDAEANSMWDDAYNGVLIQELLSKTPLTEGISLTPEEMMNYGSGNWYFKSVDGGSEDTGKTYYVPYDETNVTFRDILPQHYHNDYLIATVILLYGWALGLLILVLTAAFYIVLFSCIFHIRGKLAASLSFCCGISLLVQSVLYILGNFGYQYGNFTTLPILSEGFLSISVNMLLLGFIFSAYRYDNVIDENELNSYNKYEII